MKKLLIATLVFLVVFIVVGWPPIREFYKIPQYTGNTHFPVVPPVLDSGKETVLLLAYNKGTEIFDLIAPFYLFQQTGQANVYIVAPEKSPIALMKGFFVVPHYTLREIDSLAMRPSVLIIPHLSAMDKERPDTSLLNWIKGKFADSARILSVCAGSFTAAATGLYDGKPLTTHASDMRRNKKLSPSPRWVEGVTFTRSGALYSTAGVSNAADGSLALIRDLFGEETMKAVMESIHYPHTTLRMKHQSVAVSMSDKIGIVKKTLFKMDPDIGVLLQPSIDEFALAAILDTYHRTFPSSLKTYSPDSRPVTSKFGLMILPSGEWTEINALYELHVLAPEILAPLEKNHLSGLPLVYYNIRSKAYVIDVCLQRISTQYGLPFQTSVKRLLDYN